MLCATVINGDGAHKPFEMRITRPYAERTWRVRFREAEIRTQIWMHINEFRDLVAGTSAAGRRSLVL